MSVRCEELLKGNGISGGAARVLWRKRGLLIGQVIPYFISFLAVCSKYIISTIKGVSKVSFLGSRM